MWRRLVARADSVLRSQGRSGENRMPLVTVSESEVATASVAGAQPRSGASSVATLHSCLWNPGRSGGYQTGASINETSQQSCGGIASAQPRKGAWGALATLVLRAQLSAGHQTAACPIRGSETSPQTMEDSTRGIAGAQPRSGTSSCPENPAGAWGARGALATLVHLHCKWL